MQRNIHQQTVLFFRFMLLFRVSFFSVVRHGVDRIHAIIAWEEDCVNGLPEPEEIQEVMWILDEDSNIEDALTVGEHAYNEGWISSDCIQLDRVQLQQHLKWDNERVSMAVNKLMQIEVRMIDEGEETDSFFLHAC